MNGICQLAIPTISAHSKELNGKFYQKNTTKFLNFVLFKFFKKSTTNFPTADLTFRMVTIKKAPTPKKEQELYSHYETPHSSAKLKKIIFKYTEDL